MEDLIDVTSQTLQDYFTKLSYIGYIDDSTTDDVLLLTILNEILDDFPEFINEEDYNLITNIISNLYGKNDIISVPTYIEYRTSLKEESLLSSRITEDSSLRLNESMLFRL